MGRVNKAKVMRVTDREQDIVLYIRRNRKRILKEMQDIQTLIKDKAPGNMALIKHTIEMEELMEDRMPFNPDKLQEVGFITEKQEEYLTQAIKENKSILIIGATGVGKTTLLNYLVKKQEDVKLIIMDSNQIESSVMEERNLDIERVEAISLGVEAISLGVEYRIQEALKIKPVRVVVDEAYTCEQQLAVLRTLKTEGMSILLTGHPKWLGGFEIITGEGIKQEVETLVSREGVVHVKVGKDKETGRKCILEIR